MSESTNVNSHDKIELNDTSIQSYENHNSFTSPGRPNKRLRIQGGQYHTVEMALYQWLKHDHDRSKPLTLALLKEKGFEFYNEQRAKGYPLPYSFKASNGWLRRFQHRFGLSLHSENSMRVKQLDFSGSVENIIEQNFTDSNIQENGYGSDSPDSESEVLENYEEYTQVGFEEPSEKFSVNRTNAGPDLIKPKAVINGHIESILYDTEKKNFKLAFRENSTLHNGMLMSSFANKTCLLWPRDFHGIFLEYSEKNLEKLNKLLQNCFVGEQVIIEARMEGKIFLAENIKIV